MQAKIISARDRKKIDAQGQTQVEAVYEFTLGGLGPFIYSTPIEQDTPENLQKAISAKRSIIESGQ